MRRPGVPPYPKLTDDGLLPWERALYVAQLLGQAPAAAPKLQAAVEVLVLELQEGARPAAELIAAAERAGLSLRTLKAAKKLLRIATTRRGFGPGSVVWWEPPPRVWVLVDAKEYVKWARREQREGRDPFTQRVPDHVRWFGDIYMQLRSVVVL
jgi:hypothetical protein